ncbi:hypothetical protein [Pedobacter chitinilyticus]|uniref:DUF4783 domain-containing protein n=1 Tax=Pedobacter chitinilyticus TaxID=2233776 RepID=A0A3S3PC20_9SPHI|nr:hypothetical protein [Pedobacter chitinilyticus]RWU08122.1 hypothetical protein DPV69_07005 [Pedobacter chitinilyticus]
MKTTILLAAILSSCNLFSQTLTITSGKNRIVTDAKDFASVQSSFFESDSMIFTLNDGKTGKDSVICYILIALKKSATSKPFWITAKDDVVISGLKKIDLKQSKMVITIRRKHNKDKIFIVDVS